MGIKAVGVCMMVLALAGCASAPGTAPQAASGSLWLVTPGNELLQVAAEAPQKVRQRTPLKGLAAQETLVGIDFRVARGVLYGLSSRGQLYTIDTATGVATAVGEAVPLPHGSRFGVDFNPVADRIRVVSDAGSNQRRHPETGAVVAEDPALAWTGSTDNLPRPMVVAAGYTYNVRDDKLTTNYAIDLATGALVIQGSREGELPVVSPNTGLLQRVGMLGIAPLADAALDISDVDNTAIAALQSEGRTQLYRIDLETGRASALGAVGRGEAVTGLAIQP